MNLMLFLAAIVVPFRRREGAADSGSLLTPALVSRLRRLCIVATGGGSGQSEYSPDDYRMDPEELYNQVFFKLTDNDCEALRGITTEIPTNSWLKRVIRSTAVDMFRHEVGRVDWDKLGEHSQLVCRLVISYDYPVDEAQALLLNQYGIELPISEIERIVVEIRNRRRIKSDPDWNAQVYNQPDEETGMSEQIFVDTRKDAEQLLAKHQEESGREKALKLFLERLKPEDKLLVSLCFGLEGESMTLKEIAAVLDSTESALNKRKARIFEEFRSWLARQRVSLDELVCGSALGSAI